MRDALSDEMRTSLLVEETKEIPLMFLHFAMPTSNLRLVRNTEPVVSGGNEYLAYSGLQVTIPHETDQQLPVVEMSVPNADQVILQELGTLAATVPTTLFMALASDPEDIQLSYLLELHAVEWDEEKISTDLVYGDIVIFNFPGWTSTPNNNPGTH